MIDNSADGKESIDHNVWSCWFDHIRVTVFKSYRFGHVYRLGSTYRLGSYLMWTVIFIVYEIELLIIEGSWILNIERVLFCVILFSSPYKLCELQCFPPPSSRNHLLIDWLIDWLIDCGHFYRQFLYRLMLSLVDSIGSWLIIFINYNHVYWFTIFIELGSFLSILGSHDQGHILSITRALNRFMLRAVLIHRR